MCAPLARGVASAGMSTCTHFLRSALRPTSAHVLTPTPTRTPDRSSRLRSGCPPAAPCRQPCNCAAHARPSFHPPKPAVDATWAALALDACCSSTPCTHREGTSCGTSRAACACCCCCCCCGSPGAAALAAFHAPSTRCCVNARSRATALPMLDAKPSSARPWRSSTLAAMGAAATRTSSQHSTPPAREVHAQQLRCRAFQW